MFKLIDSIIHQFQICFKRKNTFSIFVIIIMGMILRPDLRGVTSFVGCLKIHPKFYRSLLNFFRSKAYNLENIKNCWLNIVLQKINPVMIANRITIIGDHIKISKEAKYMPGVKKHHQESENSGKKEYTFGHQFGVIGVLAEGKTKQCIPISVEMHDGKIDRDSFYNYEIEGIKKKSIVTKMVQMAESIASSAGSVNLILDAYFASKSAFEAANKINNKLCRTAISLIMRAKSNSVGFREAPDVIGQRGRGRPRKYGDKIIFSELFESKINEFSKVTMKLYGKLENVQYYCIDLIWKPIGEKVRFVLVKTSEKTMILICSDLHMEPEKIILAYSYRFKIEVSFKMLKQIMGGFFYHFWTLAMPKMSKYKTNTDVTFIKDRKLQNRILATIQAIEVFVNIGGIATGIISIVALTMPDIVWKHYTGFLRTKSSEVPSVETVKNVLGNILMWNFRNLTDIATFKIIRKYQRQETSFDTKFSA
jgi:hypothetical protein